MGVVGVEWRKLISGCFAFDRAPFAIHPLDAQRAVRLLLAAKEQLVPFDELESALIDYQAAQGINLDQRKENMALFRRRFSVWW